MGKKKRRINSQKFTRKFEAKLAKFKGAVADTIYIYAGTY